VATNPRPDARLLIGATLFGIGWGLASLCPGPAFAGLFLGLPQITLFVAAMLVGMSVHGLAGIRRRRAP
jgi:hypothetical protein